MWRTLDGDLAIDRTDVLEVKLLTACEDEMLQPSTTTTWCHHYCCHTCRCLVRRRQGIACPGRRPPEPCLSYNNTGPSSRRLERKLLDCLHRILLLQCLGYCRQLDVAGALIDGSNLAVAEHLLGNSLSNEAHPSHPLNGKTAHPACDLAGV
jgi:hypothetical protein